MKICKLLAATIATLSIFNYVPAHASRAKAPSEIPQTTVDMLAPGIAQMLPEASVDGQWHYSHQLESEIQNTCSAFYATKHGVVAIADAQNSGAGATLSFWGPDIPKPDSPRSIPVTLSQTDEQPKIVHVFNTTSSNGQGVLMFLSPSIEAALEGMWPDHHFNISMEGRTLIDITWHHGHEAKSALNRCLEAKA